MTDNYSLIPPKEIREEWRQEWVKLPPSSSISYCQWLITKAACWGWLQRDASVPSELQRARDEELEAIIAWMMKMGFWGGVGEAIPALRAARRPKPKSQAEEALGRCNDYIDPDGTIRAALERLRELDEAMSELSPAARPGTEETRYEWELEDDAGDCQAGGFASTLEDAQREGMHYLRVYAVYGFHRLIIRKHYTQVIQVITDGRPHPPR